jgi:phage gp29-like protein
VPPTTTAQVHLAAKSPRPDTTVYREPSVRTFVDWTPGLLKSAQQLADAGSLRLAADLCEAVMGDGRVQGALGQRVQGLMGLPLAFEAGKDGRRKGATVRALQEDFWLAFPESALAQLLSWGILLGVGLAELDWTEHAGRVLPVARIWHPRWLRYDWTTRDWRLTVDEGTEIPVTPGDGKWLLYTPYGAHRPWSRAAWRPVSIAWLAKKFAIQDMARHSEVHGSPLRAGMTPEGSTLETRKQFAADLGAVASDTAIALPPGFDVKLVEATARTHEVFHSEIDWANAEIAVAIVGGNLTTEVRGGSLAAAQVHNAVRQDLIEADGETLSSTLRDQALTWWAELNLGSRDVAPWPRWQTEPPEDKKAAAETLRTVAEALERLGAAGAPLDVRAVLEQFGVPMTAEAGAPAAPVATTALRAGRRHARGFIRGQLYVDAVGDEGSEETIKAFAPDLAGLQDEIEAAEDYEDLRKRIRKRYRKLDAQELAEVMEKAFLLAELDGQWAVREDL